MLSTDADIEVLKELAIANGMKTMLDDGLMKLSETTLAEILRVVPHDMINGFKRRQAKLAAGQGRKRAQAPVILDQGGRVTFSAPEEEDALVDRLYRTWIESGGPESSGMGMVDRQLFGRFIVDNFADIVNREKCSQVAFGIERNAGRVELVAFPLP